MKALVMKYKNGLLLILFLGCLVSPRYLGVNDSIFPQRLQPEPDMELQQYKIFVKFGDIVGESMQKDHNGWCVAEAFGHEVVFSKTKEETEGLLQSAMIPFEIIKSIDQATPKINEAVLKGKIFQLITVDLVRQGGNDQIFMQYHFKNAVLTSASIQGDIGQPLPMERVQFLCKEMTWKYIPLSNDGKPGSSIEYTWKFEK
ncbi:MAG: hypothetical protein COW08_08820 [Ignavibacteriales bacterium CG12_big_fil_rev_8_21_14_0_65_30_8]|nr:MAG: hypothetical protein COW08_08820 [Ignavibacteriales bacterium CG12_big_fil_rev_8_21_14_0_65_30_8]